MVLLFTPTMVLLSSAFPGKYIAFWSMAPAAPEAFSHPTLRQNIPSWPTTHQLIITSQYWSWSSIFLKFTSPHKISELELKASCNVRLYLMGFVSPPYGSSYNWGHIRIEWILKIIWMYYGALWELGKWRTVWDTLPLALTPTFPSSGILRFHLLALYM